MSGPTPETLDGAVLRLAGIAQVIRENGPIEELRNADTADAIDVVLDALAASKAEAAGGEAVAWQHPDTLPPVQPGQYGWFWVAVRRASNGRIYSFPATYLNAMVLIDENGDQEESRGNRYHHGPVDEDEGTFEATGWHDAKEHSEYTAVYLPLLDSDKDELIAWRAVPDYDAALSAPAMAVEPFAWAKPGEIADFQRKKLRGGRFGLFVGEVPDSDCPVPVYLAPQPAAGAVPEGWVPVPVEPTEAMRTAHAMYGDTSDWWNAVLAAATQESSA